MQSSLLCLPVSNWLAEYGWLHSIIFFYYNNIGLLGATAQQLFDNSSKLFAKCKPRQPSLTTGWLPRCYRILIYLLALFYWYIVHIDLLQRSTRAVWSRGTSSARRSLAEQVNRTLWNPPLTAFNLWLLSTFSVVAGHWLPADCLVCCPLHQPRLTVHECRLRLVQLATGRITSELQTQVNQGHDTGEGGCVWLIAGIKFQELLPGSADISWHNLYFYSSSTCSI